MKKSLLSLGVLFIIVSSFIIFYKFKINEKPTEMKRREIWNNRINEKKPILFSIIFQPSLKENCEVIIDFEKKYLIFKNIYLHIPEPLPPPNKNGDTAINYNVRQQPIKPFFTTLNDNDIKEVKMILSRLNESDYRRFEDLQIDGTSYNFSILFSDNQFKNGFIASEKTENQANLISKILELLNSKNSYEENKQILQYYQNY